MEDEPRRPRTGLLVVGVAVAVVVGTVVAVSRRSSPDPETARTAPVPGGVVLLGDSITEEGDWPSLLPGRPVANQGYSGFTTRQLVPVAADVAAAEPVAVFVLTGTNDIRDDQPPTWSATHLDRLLRTLREGDPDTVLVVQSVLPRADAPTAVAALNDALRDVAEAHGATWLDLHAHFDDGTGGLRPAETTDGVHLSAAGYERWAAIISAELERRGIGTAGS